MANAAQTPKLQLGKLSPEDAERLASSFRPIWELDDAPFAQGGALSAADVDALSAGAGVSPSIRGTQQHQEVAKSVPVSVPGHVPAPDAPKVEIAVDLDPADLVSATPAPVNPVVVEARPQPPPAPAARKPYAPPRPPPEPVNMRDAAMGTGDFVAVKKSNTGLIVGAVAVVAIIGVVIGVKVMGGDKTASSNKTNTSQTSPGHEEATHIPPPPEVAATQDQPTATQTAPAPPPVTAKTNDSPITKEFPTTPATHTQTAAAVPIHTAAPATTTTHTGTQHTAGGGGAGTRPGGKPAIVRDNPF